MCNEAKGILVRKTTVKLRQQKKKNNYNGEFAGDSVMLKTRYFYNISKIVYLIGRI